MRDGWADRRWREGGEKSRGEEKGSERQDEGEKVWRGGWRWQVGRGACSLRQPGRVAFVVFAVFAVFVCAASTVCCLFCRFCSLLPLLLPLLHLHPSSISVLLSTDSSSTNSINSVISTRRLNGPSW